ncbi:MAG: circadian clock protein KaiC [Legionellaceae bacterium]|nr:circadian clock protein KaiC [Legionellaceae bacterium]
MKRNKVSTGIQGLDKILNGGYLEHCPTLIKGGPGCGKTVFTLFFAKARVKDNCPVVYVTCDESGDSILSHMDSFGLEGSNMVSENMLKILDLRPVFDDEVYGEFDLSAVLLRIEQAAKKIGAKSLVIDSLQSLLLGFEGYDAQVDLLKIFNWARKHDITILTTIADDSSNLNTNIYEEYIVDCAIELKQQLSNNLMTRYLRIVKLRGSAHGSNNFPFSIFSKGIFLFPITDTTLKTNFINEYISTGIKKLDKMLGGKGIRVGSPIMFSGRSGTAKSLFSAIFAGSSAAAGKKTLILSFEESPEDFINHAKSININLSPHIKTGMLEIKSHRSVQMGLEDHFISILELNERENFEVIIIDPISSLLDLGSEIDIKMMFIRFITYMKTKQITLFFNELLKDKSKEKSQLGLSSLTDSWVRLKAIESNGEFNRMIYVVKSRGEKTSNQIKEFIITSRGIEIEDPYVGEHEMVFGTKKASCILVDQRNKELKERKIEQLTDDIKAIEEEMSARHAAEKLVYISRKNKLMLEVSILKNELSQNIAQRKSKILMRDSDEKN